MAVRVAITGGTGFVGSHLTGLLSEAGHDLVLVTRGNRVRRATRPNVRLVRADVVSGDGLVEALSGCAAAVNLTAILVERGRQTFDAVNRGGAANVAAAAREAGVEHLVHLSVLGADPDPRFPYLKSKWEGEQAVRISGVPFTILRPSLIFGPGDGFFTKLTALVRRTPPMAPVPIAGDGRTLFQPIAIQDVARCIGLALEAGPRRGVIAIGGPDLLSYEQIIDIIKAEVVSLPRPNLHIPVPAIKPMAAVMAAIFTDPLVTPSQLDLLGRNNVTTPGVVSTAFGFEPRRFAEHCAYLRDY